MITKQVRIAIAGGNVISGRMIVDKGQSRPPQEYEAHSLSEGRCYGLGRGRFANRLQVRSPDMSFTGIVMGSGSPVVQEWEVGFCQNIYSLTRTGIYDSGRTRTMRQNPVHLPIRDGDEAFPLWYDTSSESKTHLETNFDVRVQVRDDPNFDMPIRFYGNDADPFFKPAMIGGPRVAPAAFATLTGTSGEDHFKTFLVAAHEPTKSLIVLAGVEWRVHWEGTFDRGQNAWQSSAAAMVTVQDIADVVCTNRLFLNLKDNQHVQLPFSPDGPCGFDNFELQQGMNFVSCGGSGKPDPGRTPQGPKWVLS